MWAIEQLEKIKYKILLCANYISVTCALDSVPRLFNPLTPTSGETVKPYNVLQAAECISGYMPSNQVEALELKCIENNMWEISPAGHVCIPGM